MSCTNRYIYPLVRCVWADYFVLPRPFTQLVADNQHAPLGLLLIAILARVSSVLTQHLPVDNTNPTTSTTTPTPVAAAVEPKRKSTADIPGQIEPDRGVAISREDLKSSRKKSPSFSEQRPAAALHPSPPMQTKALEEKPKKKKKSKKSQKGDDFSSLFGSL